MQQGTDIPPDGVATDLAPERVGAKQAAERLDLSRSTVWRQASAWGLIGEDKKFDYGAYLRGRKERLNPAMNRQALLPASVIEPTVTVGTVAATAVENPVMSAAAEKARLQTEELRMRLAERRRELVAIAEIRGALSEAARVTRGRLLALPGRVAGELARESDPDRIEMVLQARIRELLEGLERALRGITDPDEDTLAA